MPLQTVRTSNSSLSSRAFVRVRRFEVAYRLVFVRPALAREYMNIILVRKDYSVRSSKPNPCMPGLGQGHGKKRHLHAHSPVNFKELNCYRHTNLPSVNCNCLDICLASSRLWVAITKARPLLLLRESSSFAIPSPVTLSRFPVGSSAKSN